MLFSIYRMKSNYLFGAVNIGISDFTVNVPSDFTCVETGPENWWISAVPRPPRILSAPGIILSAILYPPGMTLVTVVVAPRPGEVRVVAPTLPGGVKVVTPRPGGVMVVIPLPGEVSETLKAAGKDVIPKNYKYW